MPHYSISINGCMLSLPSAQLLKCTSIKTRGLRNANECNERVGEFHAIKYAQAT